jgi:HEPN domain-containing protein
VSDSNGLAAHGLAATSFHYRSDAPRDWSATDGFSLQQGRLGLSGSFADKWGFYGAIAANDSGLTNYEFYGDVIPVEGFRIRAGRWLVGLGPVSARRVEQRAFVDAPLATERFLGSDGLFDVGLQLRYRIPIKVMPIDIEAAILRGGSLSFNAPINVGDGGALFEKLLYVARLRLMPGAAFNQHLGLGLTFATAQNDTGPGNRTEIIGGDIEGLFNLPSDVQLGIGMEYLLRRYSIPRALEVEGALSTEVTVSWQELLAGFRADIMGLPTPTPLRERVEYRLSAVAGWTPTDWIRIRTQYSARNDTDDGSMAHEVTLQAIIGVATQFDTSSSTNSPQLKTIKTEGLVSRPAPTVTHETAIDWKSISKTEMVSAETLNTGNQYSSTVLHAQRGAYAQVRSVLIRLNTEGAPHPKSITLALRLLKDTPPPSVVAAAQRLDRDFSIASGQGTLGGAPTDFFDVSAASRAIQDARVIIGWTASL